MVAPHDDDHLLSKLAEFAQELGRFPTRREIGLKRRTDGSFPSPTAFERFGSKADLAARVVAYCTEAGGFDDAITLASAVAPRVAPRANAVVTSAVTGSVYLLRSGRFHKIGRTNDVGRRRYEMSIQLPEKVELIHKIDTDDPVGIERYWHERFSDRRANGEWFKLGPGDVAAFKRRKRYM